MAGATERHHTIAGNVFAADHAAARRGQHCRPFTGDMRLRLDGGNLYGDPDVMLVCNPQDDDPMFKSQPCMLAEISLPGTEGIDRREKLAACLKIASLREYLIVSQEQMAVDLYQRTSGADWLHGQLGADQLFSSACLPLSLTVREMYAGLAVE